MNLLGRALNKLIHPLDSRMLFNLFQRFGVHVVRNHFYNPVPDTRALRGRSDLWEEDMELVGVDLNVDGQMDLLDNVFSKLYSECDFPLQKTAVPHEYYVKNGQFGLVSASVLHSMIRHFRPKTIIEVGSGNSTYVAARACRMNSEDGHAASLLAVEPYPNSVLEQGFPGLTKLVREKAEDVDPEFFSQLESGDILFIDSSHVVRVGGDVTHLYLEILPRLNDGVIVHIHDIFFPKHYPRGWVIDDHLFWTEQYLLQAFLTYNRRFEVLWCSSYMYHKHLDRIKAALPPREGLGDTRDYFSSGFWMRKSNG